MRFWSLSRQAFCSWSPRAREASLVCHPVSVTTLPPGPTEPPAVQMIRWLVRPIAFMESCRRRFGDAFSVNFPGFERPMVMLSNPDAIRALYTAHEHGLPPGRTISLLPVMGPNSVLLLEGREHLARRKLMLPPFHGERMRSYESIMRQATERQIERWPDGTRVRDGIATDITAIKETEAEVRRQAEFLDALHQTTLDLRLHAEQAYIS